MDDIDWSDQLAEQLDWHWHEHLRPRFAGLTDEEYRWEPVPGMWSVRPRGTSAAPLAVGPGDFTFEHAEPEPDPVPVTTIAWRLAHMTVGVFGMRVAAHFGGVDIVVSNAGAAWQGRIGEVDENILRKSFELNFFGHQRVAQAAVKMMLAQRTGGCLLFNVSKQAVNPGPDFGPYGLPKAATLFLARQYALDYGAQGIRANVVNADRVRSGLLTADDVAQAFLAQALALKTTAGITTVDGGNIAAALR